MLYDSIAIDVSCLFHKCSKNSKSAVDAAYRVINRINKEALANLSESGTLYLLFDPVPSEDLALDKSFTFVGIRKKLLPDYKADRTYSPLYAAAIRTLRKYYAYRGPRIVEVYSDEYEADDYVGWVVDEALYESLKPHSGPKSVAIWSTDQDHCRYLEDNSNITVHLIRDSFKKTYEKSDFEKEFGFAPSPAANDLYKGLFGDSSDRIVGAVYSKKAKFPMPIKTLSLEAVKYVARNNVSYEEIEKVINTQFFNPTEDLDPLRTLFRAFKLTETRIDAVERLKKNLAVIKSRCDDASKFCTWNEERPKANAVIESAIKREKTPFGKRFGKI